MQNTACEVVLFVKMVVISIFIHKKLIKSFYWLSYCYLIFTGMVTVILPINELDQRISPKKHLCKVVLKCVVFTFVKECCKYLKLYHFTLIIILSVYLTTPIRLIYYNRCNNGIHSYRFDTRFRKEALRYQITCI